MLNFLLIVASVLALALVPWFGLLGAVTLAAASRGQRGFEGSGPDSDPTTRFVVVIPAHDEAGVIGVTVTSCLDLEYPHDRFQVFVIADNCSDTTAAEAEAAGALVVVRSDQTRKSKGFALEDFFQGRLPHPGFRPCHAYVLVDADTSVARSLLRVFDRSLQNGADFIQGYYTVRNADASWRTQLMTFAFSLANGVWLAGSDSLGLTVGLKGNGMCFRVAALDRFPWRVHGLVEDMEFAWALRVGGEPVRFEPAAQVFGEMVSRGGTGASSQRRRWESGRKELRRSVGQQLWRSARLSSAQKVIAQTELTFPPLSRLVAWLGVVTVMVGCGFWLSGHSVGWIILGCTVLAEWMILTAYVSSPFFIMGLPLRYLISLCWLPYYMIWKFSVGLFRAPQQWVRTPRESTAKVTSVRGEK